MSRDIRFFEGKFSSLQLISISLETA